MNSTTDRRGERMHTLINTSNKTKVSRSALKRLPQAGILVLVCTKNTAVGENDLEISDRIAGKTAGVCME